MAQSRASIYREMIEGTEYSDKEILDYVSSNEETCRRQVAYKRKQILADNLKATVDAELRVLFADVSYQQIRKYVDASQNLFRRVMKEVSLVYQKEPERQLNDGDTVQQQRLDDLTQETHLDLALARANFLLNGLNDLILQPIVVGQKISLAMFTPDQITVIPNAADPTIAEAYVLEEKAKDNAGGYTNNYIFWSPTRHFKLMHDPVSGNYLHYSVNPTDESPYKAMNLAENAFFPFIPCHATYRDNCFWDTTTNASLFEGTLLVSLQNTFKNFMMPQQFKQLAVKMNTKSEGAFINDQISNPLHIFQTNGDMTVLDWQSAIDKLDLVIQNKTAQIANDYGISAEQMKLQATAQSGFSRLVAKERIYELRDEQIKFWRIYERDIYDAIRAANNLYLLTDFDTQAPTGIVELPPADEAAFTVDFAEPKVLVDPKEDLDVKKQKIDMGLISPIDLIMAENPDIDSREKALEVYKQNLADRALVEGEGGFRTPSLSQFTNTGKQAPTQPGQGA